MIEIKHLSKSFDDKNIFDDVNISFNQIDKIYAILGESGTGKTTLFQILFGLDTTYQGEYKILGNNAKELTHKEWNKLRSSLIQIVFQDYKLIQNISVFGNLYYSYSKENIDVERIHIILDEMNLLSLKKKKVNKLSGGEKQRLAFARALINNPKIILLDEPTGNLDDTNTNNILAYIKKLRDLGVMVIIITHDSRIVPICNEIYKISGHKIKAQTTVTPSNVVVNQTNIENKNYTHHSLKYTITSMKGNFADIALSNVPIISFFILFICIFSIIWSSTIHSIDQFYNGLSPNGIYISSSNYTDKYINEMMEQEKTPTSDGKRLYFSLEDLQAVKDIRGVEDATLLDSSVTNYGDTKSNLLDLTIKKKELGISVKDNPSFSNFPEVISFSFESVSVTKDYIDIYNPLKITLLHGEMPNDNTDQMIVPDFYALTYDKNLTTIVNKKVDFPILMDGKESSKRSYEVVGVYKTDYLNNISSNAKLYLGYRDRNVLGFLQSDEHYQSLVNTQLKEYGTLEHSIFKNTESYLNAIGTGKGDLLIKLKDANDSKSVSDEIKVLFPNLKFLSIAELKTGDYKAAYMSLWKLILGSGIAISLLFGIIIIFLHRNYIKKRNKEFAILFSLGYSKKEIYRILIYEYFLTNTVNFITASLLLAFLNTFILQYTKYFKIFNNIFTIPVLSLSFLFIILMTLLSIIFSMRGIKQNNLQKYLR